MAKSQIGEIPRIARRFMFSIKDDSDWKGFSEYISNKITIIPGKNPYRVGYQAYVDYEKSKSDSVRMYWPAKRPKHCCILGKMEAELKKTDQGEDLIEINYR